MKLLIQPGDGVRPLVKAITSAKRSVEIVIFRFDQREVEHALAAAVARGVTVQALIAHTNRAGEENLRKLEMRLLATGVTVARTADDLIRYHGKFMIIDRKELYLMAFNWTYNDIERSRSFGVVTRRSVLVREAVRLFEADVQRVPYEPASDSLVVSPTNARKQLANFIKGAKKQLLIYDPKVSDAEMLRLLAQRAATGVDIRIIGKITQKLPGVKSCKLNQRLHTRAIIRDGRAASLGSQSLRSIELDARREVGIILKDPKIVSKLQHTFESDWSLSQEYAERADRAPASKVAKRVAKIVAKDLPPVLPLLNGAVKELVGDAAGLEIDPKEVEEAVKDAVKTAVKQVVAEVVEEVVENEGGRVA